MKIHSGFISNSSSSSFLMVGLPMDQLDKKYDWEELEELDMIMARTEEGDYLVGVSLRQKDAWGQDYLECGLEDVKEAIRKFRTTFKRKPKILGGTEYN